MTAGNVVDAIRQKATSCRHHAFADATAMRGTAIVTLGGGRHRPLPYAFPRDPRVARPEGVGAGQRRAALTGPKDDRTVRAGFCRHESLFAVVLAAASAAPASDRRRERSRASAHEGDGPDGPVRAGKHHPFRWIYNERRDAALAV